MLEIYLISGAIFSLVYLDHITTGVLCLDENADRNM